jgi:hypothetical protein
MVKGLVQKSTLDDHTQRIVSDATVLKMIGFIPWAGELRNLGIASYLPVVSWLCSIHRPAVRFLGREIKKFTESF